MRLHLWAYVLSAVFALSAWPAFAQDCDASTVYCVDDLNAGLSEPELPIDRETPRASVETLLFLARQDAWDDAAHLLDLELIAPEEQASRGRQLAEQLFTVIMRKAIIDWSLLIDRSDGMDTRPSSDDPMAGAPRKSLLLWTLEVDRHPVAIRLNRVQPEGGEASWVFAQQTVGDVPALYEAYGPTALEKRIPDALKRDAAFGLMWWEVLALPLVLGIAVAASVMVWKAFGWLGQRSSNSMVQRALHAARGPTATAVGTGVALFSGMKLFVFSGQISTILTPVAWFGLLASALWLVVNVVEVILDGFTKFDETDLTRRQEAHMRAMATRIAAARRAFTVAVVIIGGGVFLAQTNVFQNLGLTLLGTAGALTLVIGFAARRVLGNILASLQIALNQSARIGDRIVYNDYLCHVERINFTYVQLRDWDGTRVIVPVEEFVSTPFENWTMKEPEMLRIIKIKCAHDADVERLRGAFDDIIEELDQDELGDLDRVKVRVAGQDVFGKDVWFALPCADPNTSWDLACLAREKILAFGTKLERRENVEIFPDVRPAEAS